MFSVMSPKRSSPVRRLAAAGALGLAILVAATGASASSALDLVRLAQANEEADREDVALRRYMDALALDPTCQAAYLGLGKLRERQGDLREAERVYSVALEHVPELRAARLARARVRRALGWADAAMGDLFAGSADELEALRALAGWYGEDGLRPAQLAVWRRILVRASAAHDEARRREARTMVRALVMLVGTADPAASPADVHASTRAVLAALARRAGP